MVSELSAQIRIVRDLRRAKILFCAVPNGGRRDRRTAIMLKASGTVAGVPDLLIFDPPPVGGFVGVALELKTLGGRVSKVQKAWLEDLKNRGWASLVARGYMDAVSQLQKLGYEV